MRRPLVALGATSAAWCLPAAAPIVPALCDALGVQRRLRDGGVALTFDDGPHPEGTPAVLDALADAGAVATFFLVGEQVARDPRLAAEVAAAGHGIAVHGHRHRNLLRLTPRDFAEDLRRAVDVIGDATGGVQRLYRPPYGIFSATGLWQVRRAGWRPLLWSQWARDWSARATPESVAARATGRLRGGDVLLLHDADHYSAPGSWRRTAAALPRVLDAITQRGLETVRP